MIRYRIAMQRIIVACTVLACITAYIVFLLVQVSAQERIIKTLQADAIGYEIRIANLVQEVERMKKVVDVMESEKVISRGNERTVKMLITAYCDCAICCDKTDGITASGVKAVEGVTIAADKRYPFGTQMYIEGFGWRTVQDRGGSIQGNHVDLFFNSHSDALEFGTRQMDVIVR